MQEGQYGSGPLVCEIRWERINLFLNIRYPVPDPEDLRWYLVSGGEAFAEFRLEKTDGEYFDLSLNITNPGNRRCVPAGEYSLCVCRGDVFTAECSLTPECSMALGDSSRSFLLNRMNDVYAVNFYAFRKNGSAVLMMKVLQAENKIRPVKETVKQNSYDLFRGMLQSYYDLKARKQKKGTVLFMTEQRDSIEGNLSAVYDRMKERNLDSQYTLLTSARVSSEKHSIESWFALIDKIAASEVIFIDDYVSVLDWLMIRRDTKLIMLWHAGAGFKSAGYSRWGHMKCPKPYCCYRRINYGISGSDKISHFFSEVWGINQENVLPTGMPRIDRYMDPKHRDEVLEMIRSEYPQLQDRKVILFAPTYRGESTQDAYYPYEKIDFRQLYDFCGSEYVVLFKMHPWLKDPVPVPEQYRDRLIAFSSEYPINDLFYIADVLITDYSSNIFEFSLMGKPMLFYVFDLIEYSIIRGFHRDYRDTVPGRVCLSFDELMSALRNRDYEAEKVPQYVEKHFTQVDTGAADRIIDWFVAGDLPEEYRNRILERHRRWLAMKELDFSGMQQ